MADCLFCKIINGEIPSHKFYEDNDVIAILDIFPSHKAQTLIIPKKHVTSKFSETDPEVLSKVVAAGQMIAKRIEDRIEGVARCQVLFEGFDVDHLHMKIFPAYEPNPLEQALSSGGERADDDELVGLVEKLK